MEVSYLMCFLVFPCVGWKFPFYRPPSVLIYKIFFRSNLCLLSGTSKMMFGSNVLIGSFFCSNFIVSSGREGMPEGTPDPDWVWIRTNKFVVE